MELHDTRRGFVPAARFRLLTPAYDQICRLLGLGRRLREFELRLLDGVSAERILEVGCGSGELLRAVAQRLPDARIVGLDADPEILAIARRKLEREGLAPELVSGRAQELPFADGSFDLVLSSLMLHHLPSADKVRALAECRRVLAPGGSLFLVDFGVPRSLLTKLLLWPLRFDIFEEQADNLRGRIPRMLTEAGLSFEEVGVYGSAIVAYRANGAD